MNTPSPQPLFDTFARVKLRFERGEGAWLITDTGERYLDFTSGIAVNALGHAHPHLVAALKEQADKLWHISNLYENPQQIRLAGRLCAASFADKVFFANSGAEALECAIKTARRYHYVNGQPERFRMITFEGAFHGRTLAAIAAGGQEKYLEGFGPRVAGFDQVPFGDENALRAAITPETAAVLIEPVQGEGGVRVVPPETMRLLRRLCDENGLLLIFDEVQTGIGRTGKFLACEWSGAAPDIMAVAKGIGGGFPLGACLATFEAAKGMTAGAHGTTFGGNPLAMAAGNAVLDVVLAPGFLEHVNKTANIMKQALGALVDRYPHIVRAIRGLGLLAGLECAVPNTDVITALRQEKMLAVAAGANVMRLLPPLTVTEDEMREGLHRLEQAITRLDRQQAERTL
ncbi:MAG: Acetylornithine aminotransferase [Candidatus Tokpelaia hoelldobleri]|uniref:Acetylornithine aminotransferase n=1 Tax=Candidatus Tokpelaia hoelldobleri TaxID=1902579 RepID=A0A1U9JVJ0_9HYPH|nr:MAG: Acetylornithine aminotransferase [Candidatus Tokpelaia hoelldoblerii]